MQEQTKTLVDDLTAIIIDHPELMKAAGSYAEDKLAQVGIIWNPTMESSAEDTSEHIESLYYGLTGEFILSILMRVGVNLNNGI